MTKIAMTMGVVGLVLGLAGAARADIPSPRKPASVRKLTTSQKATIRQEIRSDAREYLKDNKLKLKRPSYKVSFYNQGSKTFATATISDLTTAWGGPMRLPAPTGEHRMMEYSATYRVVGLAPRAKLQKFGWNHVMWAL